MAIATQLAQWAKGKLSHDRVAARIVNQPQAPSAAAVAALVARPDVNAVLVRGRHSSVDDSTSPSSPLCPLSLPQLDCRRNSNPSSQAGRHSLIEDTPSPSSRPQPLHAPAHARQTLGRALPASTLKRFAECNPGFRVRLPRVSTANPQQELQRQLVPQLSQLMCGQGYEGEGSAGTGSMLTESSGASGTAVERLSASVHTSVRAATEREGTSAVVATKDTRGSRQQQAPATGAGAATAEAAEAAAAVQFLLKDVCEVVAAFGQLGYEHVNVKLEVVGRTSCPKWHADTVTLRSLVTYVGQGTWFVDNRHVTRRWQLQSGALAVSVGAVDDSQALQAGPGDLLLLKGHLWESNYGLGAVHRSPDVDMGDSSQARLLLTVDDVTEECDCGMMHSN